ncbi:CHAP domain-containing protein [Mycolicibacterium sp. ELW1]|uniref:CHAP domain-containing protein n=1 Tax=Mycobacteriaceae TaxID=1762 RepID=UPI0011F010E7|nr:CHAP domain-containing protein [Mycobacterium sp. ELW1]QEN14838.1 CHAP domain-containing protein [Mycobacterium sp. ELW1]
MASLLVSEDYSGRVAMPPPGFDVDSVASRVGLDPAETHDDNVLEIAASAPSGHSPIGLRMVEIATGQIGVCETANNGGIPLTRYVHPFAPGSPGVPWCAFFVSWCYLQTTGSRPPWNNPGWVQSIYAWAANNRRLVGTPLRGDMFGLGGNHIGLVARSLRDRVITVESNTSTGCVRSNERPLTGLWFGRPK